MTTLAKNKILAFGMLVAVVAPLLCSSSFFFRQKYIIYKMKERLEQGSIKTVSVDVVSIRWVRKNKEVLIAGKLFDVKSFCVEGDKINLTGLYDSDEDSLKEELENFTLQKARNNSRRGRRVLSVLLAPLYYHRTDQVNYSLWNSLNHTFNPFPDKKIPVIYLSIVSPPPRFT